MANILILYSTTDGHTAKICRHLQQVICSYGHSVTVKALAEQAGNQLTDFDRVVIAASIRYGHHAKEVYRFIRAHRDYLNQTHSAFCSVNLVARKPGKCQPEQNPYVRKFLRQISWQPHQVAIFAGKLDYPLYRFWDRQMIRLIMKMTGGPTAPDTVIEYTDWEAVTEFGRQLAR
ncbi:menaquinone-dependent protoporphyrinogen IX dehydrogenase [Gynuella sunshinyii]|uniref:Protoporphyrinogen IX dehydrogenase [quinone] n=1 Tax=Gynuella sunshinyii YC6258 TaxID=1445510 RepID=A0A0C5W2T1_9GAMM|nr:menaquinone-dependent protoporphyrinogen IX dehydrogenase [Gynuella sunshinyii]AJQ96979.1 flavodoxin [Gynuella sunshinyii YC6258]